MDEPERLLDGNGTALERTLLQELRSYRGPEEMRAHTLAALGATGSTGLALGGALAWLWGKSWGTKLFLTVSVASILVGVSAGYFILRQGAAPPALPAPPTVAAMRAVQPLPGPVPATPPAVLAPSASPTPPPLARVPRRGVTTSKDLRAELEALDSVRSTLARGDFSGSLSLLDVYFQRFRHGRLHLEAEVLRIDALARSGQADVARSYAKEFLQRNPKSVHASRLQSIVGP